MCLDEGVGEERRDESGVSGDPNRWALSDAEESRLAAEDDRVNTPEESSWSIARWFATLWAGIATS